MNPRYTTLTSPIGRLCVRSDGTHLTAIEFLDGNDVRAAGTSASQIDTAPELERAVRQLGEYFAGARTAFDLPLRPAGTEFQQAVWRSLAQVPFGSTTSYGAIAQAIGRPRAIRAVGAALGRNPLAIVVACHRIVGRDGSLTGYAGGVDRKSWLLRHEATGAQ